MFGNAGEFLSYTVSVSEQILHNSGVNCLEYIALHSMELYMTKSKTNASVSTFSFRSIVSFKMVPSNEQVEDNMVKSASHHSDKPLPKTAEEVEVVVVL